jgi:flagellar FliL protein
MSEFSEDAIQGKTGRDDLADALKAALNSELEELEGFGGIEYVHFTSFMLQ